MQEPERTVAIVMGRKCGSYTSSGELSRWTPVFYNFIPYHNFPLPAGDVAFDFETGLCYELYPNGSRGPFHDICNTLALMEVASV